MIGGNIKALIQIKKSGIKNDIGESVSTWEDVISVDGFLDLSNGDSRYKFYNAKIQESSHLFICDYINSDCKISSENAQMIIDGKIYDIMLIDDPMNLHQHMEIYLKYTGGQA